MFQNSTPGELLVLAFGGILALATIVSVIGSAIEKIIAIAKTAKAPEAQKNREIEEIKTATDKKAIIKEIDMLLIERNKKCKILK